MSNADTTASVPHGFTTSSSYACVCLPWQQIKRHDPDFLCIPRLLTADSCMNAGASQTSAPCRSWMEYFTGLIPKATQASSVGSTSTTAASSTAHLKGKGMQAAASGGPARPMQPSNDGTSRPGALPLLLTSRPSAEFVCTSACCSKAKSVHIDLMIMLCRFCTVWPPQHSSPPPTGFQAFSGPCAFKDASTATR